MADDGYGHENEAMNVHTNLSNLVGEHFLRSHFLIPDDQNGGYWLVVDRFHCSLERYISNNGRI
ncbi:hypothetical protein U1Q18_052545 [Sarracenia purpurea var. burkii]